MTTGRTVKYPHVLANFHGKAQFGAKLVHKQDVRAERDFFVAESDEIYVGDGRGKYALFVKLVVVGQVFLGDKT